MVGGLVLEVPALMMVGVGVSVLYFLALAVVMSSLVQVFRAAVYLYATTGEVPKGYTDDLIQSAFQSR